MVHKKYMFHQRQPNSSLADLLLCRNVGQVYQILCFSSKIQNPKFLKRKSHDCFNVSKIKLLGKKAILYAKQSPAMG